MAFRLEDKLEIKAMQLQELVDNPKMIVEMELLDHVQFFIQNAIIRDRAQKYARIHLTCLKISKHKV